MHGSPALTRRGFVQIGGALLVSFSLAEPPRAEADEAKSASTDPSLLASWLEIRSDNTVIARTGKTETGTGMSAFFAQTIAEELGIRPEAVTLITGDTDETPDGGYSAGFLWWGAPNLRKVSAYTRQALLGLAAARLSVPVSALSVTNGVVSRGGQSVSYGQLVAGQQLDLKIPISGKPARVDASDPTGVAGLDGYTVTGKPPLKPMSQYTVVGQSHPMPGTPDKVTGKTVWSCDFRLPEMLHARMIRPATLGSALISIGSLDKKRFPTAEVVRKGNLVAVVSPDEWEAITAAQSVAAGTKWTAWAGLPGSDHLTKAIREYKWGPPTGSRGNAAGVAAGLRTAARTVSATYEQPYVRHAPIGPYVAVADVRRDGSATVWTHSAHSQGLRVRLAQTLSTPVEKVVVKWLDQSGQYGRATFGGDGAEADAAILSQLTGKPVRVQWTLQEDLAWSSVSPGWVADLKAGLDANGAIVAFHSTWYGPHNFDARLLGAILAGMPSTQPKTGMPVATEWAYGKIPNVLEEAHGMPNIGSDSLTGGLRGNIMRTPMQRQQNFAVECLLNEAASAAGADPLEFRLKHTADTRLIDVLKATAEAAGWQTRPSPHSGARRTGAAAVAGRGIGIIIRENAYWAGIAEIEVTPATGAVIVTRFTMGLDCGKIINPRQLNRVMRGGLMMGLSEALKEEVTFDTGKVTSTDWGSYPILTMQEMPEIRLVHVPREDKGFGTGGEAANAVAPAAIAAAFFDATGVPARRLPLTPKHVQAMLKS